MLSGVGVIEGAKSCGYVCDLKSSDEYLERRNPENLFRVTNGFETKKKKTRNSLKKIIVED